MGLGVVRAWVLAVLPGLSGKVTGQNAEGCHSLVLLSLNLLSAPFRRSKHQPVQRPWWGAVGHA